MQLAGALQLFILGHGGDCGEPISFHAVNALLMPESMRKCSISPRWLSRQTFDRQVNRRRGGGKIIVMIIPDQDLDFILLARGDRVDVRLSAYAVANYIVGWKAPELVTSPVRCPASRTSGRHSGRACPLHWWPASRKPCKVGLVFEFK